MFYMVSYDITDDTRRRRIQKILEGFGARVQYSVFECEISEPHYRELRTRVVDVMDGESAIVRFYNPCTSCSGKTDFIGNGAILEDDSYFIV